MSAGPSVAGSTGAPLDVLRRIAAARPPVVEGERCEMCAQPISEAHQHMVNLDSRGLMCSCRACYLLFTAENAKLRYRAVPERYLSFPSFSLDPAQWDALEIPVGMAFFFANSVQDKVIALYPGPAGAAESELPLGAWDEIAAANPEFALLLPDVEALLIKMPDSRSTVSASSARPNSAAANTVPQCYLVPIDSCFELVGRLRRTWRGFDGGQDARAEIDQFFAALAARSRPASAPPDRPPGQP